MQRDQLMLDLVGDGSYCQLSAYTRIVGFSEVPPLRSFAWYGPNWINR